MKTSSFLRIYSPRLTASLAAIAILATQTARAANGSWNVNAAGNWATAANPPWLGGTVPGSNGGTTSTDIATFGFTLTADRIVTVDANRNIGGITFSNNSAFKYTLSGGNLLLSNGGTILSSVTSGAHTDTISSPIAIQGDGGSATFTNNSPNNTGLLTISGSVSGVSTAGNTTTLTLNGSNGQANLISGVITDGTAGGSLALVKNGSGYWRLTKNNTFSGGVTLNAGTLDSAFNGTVFGSGTLTINGGTFLQANNAGTIYNNAIAVGGNFTLTAASSFTFAGDMDLGGATRTITASAANAPTLSGVISNGGLTKAGTGVLILSGSNTYSGNTTVSAGILRLGASNVLANGAGKGNLSVTGTLDLNGNSETINGLSGAGTVDTVAGGSVAFTVGDNDQTSTFSGVIKNTAGSLSLSKTGTGTLTLSGTNTYTGATTVSVGTLVINGSIAASSGVSVSSGAALAGRGSVSALSGAGSINPGNSPGILTAPTLNLSGGLDFNFELTATGNPTWSNAAASVNDVLHLTNTSNPFASTTATAANVFDIYLGVSGLANGNVFNGGFFATPDGGDFASLVSGGTYNYFVLGDGFGSHLYNGVNYYTLAEYNTLASTSWTINNGTAAITAADFATGTVDGYSQQFTVVPEPSTWVLLTTGLTAVMVLRRRRVV